jgi:ferrous iron transport protein A
MVSAAPTTDRLHEQPPGRTMVIHHIEGRLDATGLRLLELGLVPGALVTVIRVAPLGDPLELSVLGTRVCVRKKDASAFVVVAPTADAGVTP